MTLPEPNVGTLGELALGTLPELGMGTLSELGVGDVARAGDGDIGRAATPTVDGDKVGWSDGHGNWWVEPRFKAVEPRFEGVAVAREPGGAWFAVELRDDGVEIAALECDSDVTSFSSAGVFGCRQAPRDDLELRTLAETVRLARTVELADVHGWAGSLRGPDSEHPSTFWDPAGELVTGDWPGPEDDCRTEVRESGRTIRVPGPPDARGRRGLVSMPERVVVVVSESGEYQLPKKARLARIDHKAMTNRAPLRAKRSL